jgi:hypothetical protein
MDTMKNKEEILKKCEWLSDYYLDVFESYWGKLEHNYSDEEILYVLSTDNVVFTNAFAVWTKDIKDLEYLSDEAIQSIVSVYDYVSSKNWLDQSEFRHFV